jgi:hypothetical protein
MTEDRVPSALDPALALRLKRDRDGLVAAVVQQHGSGEVLMVGWMDEALHRTLTTGRATLVPVPRRVRVKGETSGHAAGAVGGVGLRRRRAARPGGPDWPGVSHGCANLLTDGTIDRQNQRMISVEELSSPVPRPCRRTVLFADGERRSALPQAGCRSAGHVPVRVRRAGRSFSPLVAHRRGSVSLIADGDQARWVGAVPAGLATATTGDPLAALGAAWRYLKSPRLPGLPSLTGGLVGYLGYDVARWIERLPELAAHELELPELTMLLVTDVAAYDHHECTVTLIANVLVDGEMSHDELAAAHAEALARLDSMQRALGGDAPATVAVLGSAPPGSCVADPIG